MKKFTFIMLALLLGMAVWHAYLGLVEMNAWLNIGSVLHSLVLDTFSYIQIYTRYVLNLRRINNGFWQG